MYSFLVHFDIPVILNILTIHSKIPTNQPFSLYEIHVVVYNPRNHRRSPLPTTNAAHPHRPLRPTTRPPPMLFTAY